MKLRSTLLGFLGPQRSVSRVRHLAGLLPAWLLTAFGLGLAPQSAVLAADLFVQVYPPGWTNMAPTTFLAGWGDYDGDGFLDALVQRESTGNPVTDRPRPNLLYRNNGDGSFTLKGPDEVGPIASDESSSDVGLWGDANNDGRLDLLVLNLSYPDTNQYVINRLYLNQGNGRFTSAQAGSVTEPYRTRAVGNWCDFDNDGVLDVFLPSSRSTDDDSKQHLLRGRGDGSFDTVTEGSMASDQPGNIDPVWSDLDGDGDSDLLVPYFGQHNLFYRNDGHGQFTRLTNSLLEQPQYRFIVPITGDLDNDGDVDLVANTATPEALTVFFNDGLGAFVPVQTLPEFNMPFLGDYDNDGDLDLLMSGGSPVSQLTPMRLYRNDGTGRLELVDDALTRSPWAGGPWVDDNNDGFMDLHACRLSGNKVINVVFRNQGNGNHWLKVRLVGTASNRSAIGAKVRVRASFGGKTVWQMRELISHYLAEDGQRAHFGLAEATKAEEVRIEWPSGNVQTLTNLAADQILTVTEPTFFQPVQPVATINGSFQITSTVTDTTRQWYFEGAPLEGQTGRTLALPAVQPAQEGRYSVVAQTADGWQTNHVYLRVLAQFAKVLEGSVVTNRSSAMSATWFDYDNDGSVDLFVANSSPAAAPSVLDMLYHNQGDGTFVQVESLAFPLKLGWSWSGSAGDFDNDGDLDLFVNQDGGPSGSDQLFRNNGDGSFGLVSGQPFNAQGSASQGGIWADYDRDGDLDLFAFRGDNLENTDDALYRNNGDGTFTTVSTAEAGPLVDDRLPDWTAAWLDCDGDGAQDLLVSYVGVGVRLYHNERNGSFTVASGGSLTTVPGDGSISPADYDNDGWPDLFITAFSAGRTALHRNLGDGTFFDATLVSGIQVPPISAMAVGTWADYDNDGFIDLFVTGSTTNNLYRNRGDGTFQSVNVGNLHTDGDWGSVGTWGDYDNNGFPDLYLVIGDTTPQPSYLYRNTGNGNHWLKVKLVGTASNRDGMGAAVRVEATLGGRSVIQWREISGNAGFSGGGNLIAHFGLGSATNATIVRVEWPSGIVQELTQVASDQVLTLTEPAPIQLTIARVADGIRLEWRGQSNTVYRLQSSPGLTTWGASQPVTSDAAGTATAIVSPDATARFFRVVQP
ncbi:MAG: VCBS repeat-containing protein [Verrucomicrobiales bacterium]|nr:VCBS repeat-containing protein [Verrucomicrobiales bacterium]